MNIRRQQTCAAMLITAVATATSMAQFPQPDPDPMTPDPITPGPIAPGPITPVGPDGQPIGGSPVGGVIDPVAGPAPVTGPGTIGPPINPVQPPLVAPFIPAAPQQPPALCGAAAAPALVLCLAGLALLKGRRF